MKLRQPVLSDEGEAVYLETQLPDAFARAMVGVVSGQDLERVRFVDANFEERDGAPAVMDVDLLGDRKVARTDLPGRSHRRTQQRSLARARLVTTWCGEAVAPPREGGPRG